jgi:CDP-diacylglycerol--glycerol-3-phosphate 3-phosphatidyltransferase
MLRRLVGDRIEGILAGVARFLHFHKISPNALTLIGLTINGIGAFLYYQGYMLAGGIVILFGGLFDMLDGAVARAGKNTSKMGAFTDSVVDRYSDFIIFGGVLAYFAKSGDLGRTILVLVIIYGTFLVSYVRARAELAIPKCAVGVMQRPERIIVLAAGSIFGLLDMALWVLAVFTHLTALHRIYYTYQTLRASPSEGIQTNRD